MEELLTLIADVQQDVFDYRLDQFSTRFLQLIDLLATGMQGLAQEDQAVLNPVLNAILTGYERKDYLLVADLLEFELKPLFTVEG